MFPFDTKAILRKKTLAIHRLIFRNDYEQILNLIEPGIFGIKKKAFGRKGDGRYIVPEDLISKREYTLLSFGISDDISFETELNKVFPGIRVYAFDPTVDCLPEENPFISFCKIGLAGKQVKRKKLITLKEVINRIGIPMKAPLLLKLDIEGWEWGVLKRLPILGLNVDIIIIELHFFPLISKSETAFLPVKFKSKYHTLKRLLKEYFILHIHANNYEYFDIKERKFPSYLELTLISKKFLRDAFENDIRILNSPTFNDKKDWQYPFYNNKG